MARSSIIVAIFCMLFAPLYAGSFSSAEHRFDFHWTDDWSVNDKNKDSKMLVDLVKENRGFSFQIAVEPIDLNTVAEDYLASERSVKNIYERADKRKVLVDEMIKINQYPARKIIFETKQNMVVGVVQILANDALYMLICIRANPDFKYFQKAYDHMLSNFSLKGDFGSDF